MYEAGPYTIDPKRPLKWFFFFRPFYAPLPFWFHSPDSKKVNMRQQIHDHVMSESLPSGK